MSNETNQITSMPMKKHDDSQERNLITGVSQDVKKEADIKKSDGVKVWPSISDLSKRKVTDLEPEPQGVAKSTDAQPWPSMTQHLTGQDVSNEAGEFEKSWKIDVPIIAAIEKAGDERVVYGIVYEPDTVDAQGDQASAEEIKKAAYGFMENNPTFKIQHKGKAVNTAVLESFIAPADYTIEKRIVKKGSWILVTRINDKKLWKAIKDGTYTGYSMAGYAKVEEN